MHRTWQRKLVEWSKRVDKGTENMKSTIWGLGVVLTANADQPYYDILLDEPGLKAFCENLGQNCNAIIRSYGITLALSGEEAAIFVAQDKENVVGLYNSTIETITQKGHSYLGRIFLGENGPIYYTPDEIEEHAAKETVTEIEVKQEVIVEQTTEDQEDIISMRELEELLLHAVE